MFHKKKKSLLFYKYLFSYMTIFLVPFIITSGILYHMAVTDLQGEIIQSNTEKLEQVKDLIGERKRELKNIATRISYDPRLTPYMLKQPYESIQAIRELNTYKVNSSFISELYLYYKDGNRLYSPNGSGTIETFMNKVYQINPKDREQLITYLKTTKKPINFPVSIETGNHKKEKVITFIYPIPVNSANYGSLMFIVKEKVFTKLITGILGEFKGSIFIFNEKEEIVASNTNGRKLLSKDIQTLAKGKKAGIEEKVLNNEEYSIVRVRSDVSNWTFISAVPTKQFYSKMGSLKRSILIILSFIIIIGVSIAVTFTFKQYKPIYNITQILKSSPHKHPVIKSADNELVKIKKSIESMYTDNEILQNRMEIQKPFVRDQFLLKLLNGDTRNINKIKYILEDLHISMDEKYFTAVISFNEKGNKQESLMVREKLLSWLSSFTFKDCKGYGVELIYENAIALIVSISPEGRNIHRKRKSFVDELNIRLQKSCTFIPRIGVGSFHQGVERINHSFIEANASLDYNILEDITYFEEILQEEQSNASFWYPIDQQVRFTQSLKQGDLIVAQDTLRNILKSLNAKENSIYLLRCMCFDVINTVLKSISELGISHHVKGVKKLIEFNSLTDLEEQINLLLILICREVEERKESHNNKLRDNILDYVSYNYKSYDLSLESVAEQFQLSVSYLSRFIKEQTGTTFTQYVWDLRNQEFKRQLTETNCSIKDIVQDVGYMDVANFTRKFKQSEGITPGQFRKQYG